MLLMFPYGLVQCFPNFFACRPLLASKTNHGSSYTCSRKYSMSGWGLYKIKNLYIRTDFR